MKKKKKSNCQSSSPSPSPRLQSLPTTYQSLFSPPESTRSSEPQLQASCSGSSTPLFLAGILFSSLECVDAGVSPRIESLANYQSQFSLPFSSFRIITFLLCLLPSLPFQLLLYTSSPYLFTSLRLSPLPSTTNASSARLLHVDDIFLCKYFYHYPQYSCDIN